MYEEAFKNIDDVLWKDAGCSSELDYLEQTSWILFLKYLDDYEIDKETAALLNGEAYERIIDNEFRWEKWAYPKTVEGEEDPSSFVWDEFVGMWVACIPLAIIDFPLMWLFISFLLFRIFDIWKPLGIKVFDRKHGAFYVMIDDVLAGMFTAIIVIFLSFFLI